MNNLACLSIALFFITEAFIHVAVTVPLPPHANVAQASSSPSIGARTPGWGPTADVAAACAMAKDKAFCVSTLSRNPQSKGLDQKHLALLALQMALNKATEVYRSFQQKLQKEFHGALNDCSDQYSGAVGHINNCVNALLAEDDDTPYNDMRTWLSEAKTSDEVCQRGIVEAKLPNDNGGDFANNDFTKLCDNAISVITTMQSDALEAGQTNTLS